MVLRQKPCAIRHPQLNASDIKIATVRLCVKPRCSAFPGKPGVMNKSRSGALASSISTPRRGRYWRQCPVSRVLKRPFRARKVQNPAKLCAIGDAIGQNVNGLTRPQQKGRIGFVYKEPRLAPEVRHKCTWSHKSARDAGGRSPGERMIEACSPLP